MMLDNPELVVIDMADPDVWAAGMKVLSDRSVGGGRKQHNELLTVLVAAMADPAPRGQPVGQKVLRKSRNAKVKEVRSGDHQYG